MLLRLALLLVLAAAALALAAEATPRQHPATYLRSQRAAGGAGQHLPPRNSRGHVLAQPSGKRHHGWCGTDDDRLATVAASPALDDSGVALERDIPMCSYYGDECDDPDVVAGYEASYDDLPAVYLNARTYEFATDAGTGSLMTQADFDSNTAYINSMYGAHNIHWNFTRVVINSTLFQARQVLPDCEPAFVTDSDHYAECFAEVTGYSAYPVCWSASTGTADCDPQCTLSTLAETCTCICLDDGETPTCSPSQRSNGACEPACNFFFGPSDGGNWDSGQCCPGGGGATCRDPQFAATVSGRGWVNAAEAKLEAQEAPYDSHLAIYLLNLAPEAGLLGISTFPMDPTAFQNGGGIMLNAAIGAWGDRTTGYDGGTAVHEMGHSVGLYHTHAGVTDLFSSKTAYCSSDCSERQPSSPNGLSVSTVGDFCADTRPTPVNYECADPDSCATSSDPFCGTCSRAAWVNTPYRNFMGYAPDSCYNAFSVQQMSRARCVIDTFLLSTWGVAATPAVDLPGLVGEIRVASSSASRIRLDWTSPVWPGAAGMADIQEYRVSRQPPFASGPPTVAVDDTEFTDEGLIKGATYVYSVVAVNSKGAGPALSKSAVAQKSAAAATLAAAGASLLAMAAVAVTMML